MPDFRRLIEDLWGLLDPDEPMLCECTSAWQCSDCALAVPVDGFAVPSVAPVEAGAA